MLGTAEVYDPSSGTFAPQESMDTPRQDHTTTLLADGRVLVAGGYGYDVTAVGLSSTEIFDPAAGTFTAAGSLADGRGDHTATRLANGRVVVTGGHTGAPGEPLASAEIFDPGTDSFGPAGTMASPRGAHTATLLPDGKLLVVGGFSNTPFFGAPLASAEIYDPGTASFAPSVSMHEARGRHAAAALPGAEVLVAGGFGQCCGGPFASAEVFSASVVDTTPPTVTVPFDRTVLQDSPQGAVVVFEASAVDDVDTAPTVSCDPASGSTFPVGTTTVVCTATDSSGNEGTGSFLITVVEPLDIAITIAPTGTVHPQTGLATLRGTVSCNRKTQRGIAVELSQGSGNKAVQGSLTLGFACVPPSLDWIVSVNATNGRFRPGKAQAHVSGDFCDSFGCDSDSVVASVQLVSGVAGGGEFPIAKIVDSTTRMPGSRSDFGSLGVPFVRSGIVVFQGYGQTLSESGLYSSRAKA